MTVIELWSTLTSIIFSCSLSETRRNNWPIPLRLCSFLKDKIEKLWEQNSDNDDGEIRKGCKICLWWAMARQFFPPKMFQCEWANDNKVRLWHHRSTVETGERSNMAAVFMLCTCVETCRTMAEKVRNSHMWLPEDTWEKGDEVNPVCQLQKVKNKNLMKYKEDFQQLQVRSIDRDLIFFSVYFRRILTIWSDVTDAHISMS